MVCRRTRREWRRTAALAVALVLGCALASLPGDARAERGFTHVVVALSAPPLAEAHGSRARAARVIAAEQRRFAAALHRLLPEAKIHWHYRLVLNGVSVVVPTRALAVLATLPGARQVFPAARYRTTAVAGPNEIGAPILWGEALAHAGQGMKIAIIDDGVDQTHPYFDPTGFTMPAGFPKGQRAFTTAKVIVARAFAPPGATWKHARTAFDPEYSEHGTHVAGIAAGNADTAATGGRMISGVAPRAYLGSYKALTIPTDSGLGLNGNAPEIVAAIEAAVADGMDVINLSIGEPEIEPSRDAIALALDAAADAGVIPVAAAGNDYTSWGRGSVISPGTAVKAITVAAVTSGTGGAVPQLAGFSSAGPTPLSLRLKPDVSAPGTGILSSVPGSGWRTMSGTSMASPHVAGAAALLREQHPAWTVAQIKASLIATGRTVNAEGAVEATPTRGGGGMVDLAAANNPLVLASPAAVSFGLVPPDTVQTAAVELEDAGGGAGEWSVSVQSVAVAGSVGLSAPPSVVVPGRLELTLATAGAALDELSGFVHLERNGVVRRIPFWGRVSRPALTQAPSRILTSPGVYPGDTRGRTAQVTRYLYPELQNGGAAENQLLGPEQVFRIVLPSPLANFGVVITARKGGAKVEPRIIAAGDENRLAGYAALPVNINPYLEDFQSSTLSAGVLSPLAGAYDVVFDSPSAATAGAYTFRLWVNDTTPPSARLVRRVVARGKPLLVQVTDSGSGVDASSLRVTIDGNERTARLRDGTVRIATLALGAGRHRLRLQLSDHQETRNDENVSSILPNTQVLSTTFTIRRP